MKKAELEFMINYRVEQMIQFLMEDYDYSMLDAFDTVYNSQTYQKLINQETGLYFQSPGYVFSYLQDELGMSYGD